MAARRASTSWAIASARALSQGWPLVSFSSPSRKSVAPAQAEGPRAPAARQPGTLARGARPAEQRAARLVALLRLRDALPAYRAVDNYVYERVRHWSGVTRCRARHHAVLCWDRVRGSRRASAAPGSSSPAVCLGMKRQSESRMREIRTSGLMSGAGKRSDANAVQTTAPLPDSTTHLGGVSSGADEPALWQHLCGVETVWAGVDRMTSLRKITSRHGRSRARAGTWRHGA